jgi:inosose dehydratase
VAVAPDSWGVWFADDPRQVHWSTFLDEAAAAGFDAVELGPWGYLPTTVEVLRPELERRGLTLTGAFVMADFLRPDAWELNKDHVREVCDLLHAFGAGHLVLLSSLYTDLSTGAVVGPRQLDDETWPRMLAALHAIGELSAREGVRSVFHPHADSVVEYEETIEALLEHSDPASLSLCLDIGHHAYAGGDAVSFMRRHHDRIPYLHLKNVDPVVIGTVRSQHVPFAAAVAQGAFTTLDAGTVDLRAFRDVLDAAGYDGWAVVEQDMFPAPPDRPLPVARHNRNYLREIGLGGR